MSPIAALLALLLACPRLALAEPARYESVNGGPQFNADDDKFSFYWGVWRQRGPEYAAVSEREIRWETRDCATGDLLNADGERYWYLDRGEVAQAARDGYQYLVSANLLGGNLRGAGPYVRVSRQPGETREAYDLRVTQALDEWRRRASLRGARGQVRVRTEVRLLGTPDSRLEAAFAPPSDPVFSASEDPRHAPDRWPVYFDERAHKPHAATEPAGWAELPRDPSPYVPLQYRLEWDGCAGSGPVRGEVVFPSPDRLPPAGPDRGGRSADPGSPAGIRFESPPTN